MSMLSRYKKSGGFIQLLTLIETSSKQKQENFLSIVEKESFAWANAIREKMITIEMIFAWSNEIVAEISGRLQELTIATVMHGLTPENHERLLSTYTHAQRRNIEDLFKAKSPTPAEVNAAYLKILQEVRKMISDGYLHVDKFAPNLIIEKGIEEKLEKNSPMTQPLNFEAATEPSKNSTTTASSSAGNNSLNDAELIQLRTRVQALMHENHQLKSELKLYKDKIEQIKKIA